jgi:MscS family membrane protein
MLDQVDFDAVTPWFAAAGVVLGAFIAGVLLARLIRGAMTRMAARTSAEWDDVLVANFGGPLGTGLALIAIWSSLAWLRIDPRARGVVEAILTLVTTLTVAWLVFRIIDAGREILSKRSWAAQPSARSLLALMARILKMILLIIALITGLALLGVPVASLVAGLGIGGLAIALAARSTLENLFGTISIGVDQPFREGDFVRIGGEVLGTVEAIGLRSTRVRSLDRTIVTIPNGQLADARTETFAARDRIRFHAIIGVVYGTTGAQLREILAGFERVLREHPRIWPDPVNVRFQQFGASSLDIEVMCWFQVTDWGKEFLPIRQEILLAFMELVERSGSSFAFPTRTVHLVNSPPAP